MHRYKVRPGYGSKNLLIEFSTSADRNVFRHDIRSVFERAGATPADSELIGMEVFDHFDSPAGSFTLNEDDWGLFWIFAEENQSAISLLDKHLKDDPKFDRESADFSKYNRSF